MKLRKENILIVDDDYDMLELIHRNLKSLDYHVYKASSVTEAIEILKDSTIDLLITDLQMPGINGIELIKYAKEHIPDLPKLVITGYPSVDSVLNSLKAGAIDYLVKPFTNDEFRSAVQKSIISNPKSKAPRENLKKEVLYYGGMIGTSTQFQLIADIIERIKNNRATILIQGESGTGKELIARAIHYNGAFSAKPFIAVNCGGIPENLLESELFGHVKGAFTGAGETREGMFQAADGGTIFLDEIGNASQKVQTRLLRVLQEKEVNMIGSTKAQKIMVRVIAATNSDLYAMTKTGIFREDLYYRLNVVDIMTPPLRERKEDILPIAELFLKKYGQEYGKPNITIDNEALELLRRHSWPGNVRELENLIQKLIIMSGETIEIDNLPEYLKYTVTPSDEPFTSLKEFEKAYILRVLASVDGNKSKAAAILQIDRKTLRQKLL